MHFHSHRGSDLDDNEEQLLVSELYVFIALKMKHPALLWYEVHTTKVSAISIRILFCTYQIAPMYAFGLDVTSNMKGGGVHSVDHPIVSP